MKRRILALAVLAALVLVTAGCFNPFAPKVAPTAGIFVPPPSPTTPAGVVRLLAWCWRNRDITLYKEVFTEDFQFIFALKDSAGNPSRDPPLTREGELNMARNLFQGGGVEPPATSIMLNLDPTLNPQDDSRPGKAPRWHKEILTRVDLAIEVESGKEYRIEGYARFYVVRGDSAMIPDELAFPPDTNRWYIERWNDETFGDAGAAARPAAGLARARVPVTVTSVRVTDRAAPRSSPWMPPVTLTWQELRDLYLD